IGIAGQKGHIHVAFGEPFQSEFQHNDSVVVELDQQIQRNYVLHSSNCFAWQVLHGEVPKVLYSDRQIPFDPVPLATKRQQFDLRMEAIPSEHRRIALEMYANPVAAKLTQG